MSVADVLSVMPLILTGVGALLVLLLGPFLQRGLVYCLAVAAGTAAGVWGALYPASYTPAIPGISFSPLARYLVPIFCIAGVLTLLYSHGYNDRHRIEGEEYPATVLFGLFAMCVLPCATNLLTLFLALESIAFAFYILVAIDLNRAESGEAGLKYLLFGAVAAAFTAFGISLIFAGSGSLELSAALDFRNRAIMSAGWGMILIGIAFKLSLVPGHLWTPDVYQGAPAPVAGFLSTGSKVAAAAFLLLLLGVAAPARELHVPLFALSLLSMVLGNLAALRQNNIKRMLAYSSIAHMGYLTLALLTGTRDGYAAVLLYGAIYTAMNLAAFGAIAALSGDEERARMEEYSGVGYSAPFRAGVLALAMIALAGIPPTAGFMGKFFIFYSAVKGGEIALAIIGIISAAISAYFYLRVVVHLYMRPAETTPPQPASPAESAALFLSAAAIVVIGVFPNALLHYLGTVLR
ncbi:NADH-quinone oxidoreductase subunit N [Geomesophilobacter sediminis]|uniref:NADH-quinone oxidoreductase subunit N n=1 Tax=Geomesophilobacter sediminis TaxID=2798584 RepID=A0A8J7IRP8_9BACT|nr:NADH-quinone oxidoreductase subunit N [Geomesophilobacter sediminis]MBJ6725689.1 NADH-quinone oxidoreductase subunit N [Geomesophilobacter sediminis]